MITIEVLRVSTLKNTGAFQLPLNKNEKHYKIKIKIKSDEYLCN